MKVLAHNASSVQRAVKVTTTTTTTAGSSLSRRGSSFTPFIRRRSTPPTINTRTMAFFGGGNAKTLPSSIYDISVTTIDGKDISMSQFKNKVVLVVNVASACGFTPQYTDMAQLYDKYKGKGFEILAFPCNAFGGQEPAANPQIKQFAQNKGAKFQLLAKGEVNGPGEHPLFTYLKNKKGGILGDDIKWNFAKFLVDKNGNVVGRWPSTTSPMELEGEIVKLL